MATLHIHDVPGAVLDALLQQARRNSHSLEVEVRAILQATVPLKLHFSAAAPETAWSREKIYGDEGR
jgi:plasmid stability protein